MRTLHPASGPVTNLAFSPDSKTLAALVVANGSAQTDVVMWDMSSGEGRSAVRLPYLALGIAYVDGGRWLATSELNQGSVATPGAQASARVDLWDSATLLPVGDPLMAPGDAFFLSPDRPEGYLLATSTSSASGTPLVIDLDPAHWEGIACGLAGRNLTRAEWAQYLPGRPYQQTCPQWPPG